MNVKLVITVLGNPVVALQGQPVSGFISGKAAALVYYLAVTGRTHRRSHLAGLLWSEVNEQQAQKNLRDVLSNLRRLLEPYLLITRETVGLVPEHVLVDSQAFESAHETARDASSDEALYTALREGIALYRGDLLDGFFVGHALGFEEWLYDERERLRQLLLHALHTLASYATEQGNYFDATAYTTRLLALDSRREESHHLMMRLLTLSGQAGAALTHYEHYRARLLDELGLEPCDELSKLYHQIRDGELQAAPQAVERRPSRVLRRMAMPLTGLLGRELELAQAASLLQAPASRLLTITGPGGVGKTRLALELLERLHTQGAQHLFAHGVVLVPLATGAQPWPDDEAASATARLATRIVEALGLVGSGPTRLETQVLSYLRDRQLLLVLDNFEPLLAAASFVIELLRAAPQLKILVTSRVRLHVRGEQIIDLDGLSFPPDLAGIPQPNYESYSAVQLFLRRAREVVPAFAITGETELTIARICKLVDGLPLGIELAASLVRLLSCSEIERELTLGMGNLQLLHRDVPDQHQNLQVVFEHSWALLAPEAQQALVQLAVFRGGFDRDAATAVAGATLPLLALLMDHSLVRRVARADGADAPMRYALLEVVRQFAAQKLLSADSQADSGQLADRHGRHYLTLLQRRTDDLRSRRQQVALAELSVELENIRAAWRWGVVQGQHELLGATLDGLFHLCEMRSLFQEGEAAFGFAAAQLANHALAGASPQVQLLRGRLLSRQGWFTFQLGRHSEARAMLAESLALLRSLGHEEHLIVPLYHLAAATLHDGDYEAAQRLCREGLQISEAHQDGYRRAIGLTILGQIAFQLGRYDEARRYCEDSIRLDMVRGHGWGIAFSYIGIGNIAVAEGAYAEAVESLDKALAIREMLGDVRGIALCLLQLGRVAQAQADLDGALRYYNAGHERFAAIGNQWGVAMAQIRLGELALDRNDTATAWECFVAALLTALATQAAPLMVEALIGAARALATESPEQARTVVRQLVVHPAVTAPGRRQAAALLARLQPGLAVAEADLGEPEAQPLETVIAALLRRAPNGYETRLIERALLH